jgi:hypothetical protein
LNIRGLRNFLFGNAEFLRIGICLEFAQHRYYTGSHADDSG